MAVQTLRPGFRHDVLRNLHLLETPPPIERGLQLMALCAVFLRVLMVALSTALLGRDELSVLPYVGVADRTVDFLLLEVPLMGEFKTENPAGVFLDPGMAVGALRGDFLGNSDETLRFIGGPDGLEGRFDARVGGAEQFL
jgi:hypothetical protein